MGRSSLVVVALLMAGCDDTDSRLDDVYHEDLKAYVALMRWCHGDRDCAKSFGFPLYALASDMNRDGHTTISDVGLWGRAIFCLPGDTLLWAMSLNEEVATFFEIGGNTYSGWVSAGISLLLWAFLRLVVFAFVET